MLRKRQVVVLAGLSLFLWVIATLYIHLMPGALSRGVRGDLGFVASFPVAWLSVRLTKAVGRLAQHQLLTGVMVVGALAMMIDGAVLRWFPRTYSTDLSVLQFGAAWLLWGYGASFLIALAMTMLNRATNPF